MAKVVLMNLFGSLLIAGIVMAAIVIFYIQPWRTVANFCTTYTTGKNQLLQQWSRQGNQGSDDFSKFVNSFATAASSPTDLANFFDKLDGVAPHDIEPDIATIRDSFKKETDIMVNTAGGNILGGLASGLMLGLSSQGAFTRVNAYIIQNCDPGQRQSGTMAN